VVTADGMYMASVLLQGAPPGGYRRRWCYRSILFELCLHTGLKSCRAAAPSQVVSPRRRGCRPSAVSDSLLDPEVDDGLDRVLCFGLGSPLYMFKACCIFHLFPGAFL
jgi:hypothetical protein